MRQSNSIIKAQNSAPRRSVLRFRYLVFGLLAVGLSTTARAQESFTYSFDAGTGPQSGTAQSYAEALQRLNAMLPSSARFQLDSVYTLGGAVNYSFRSTPYKFTFWNQRGWNCFGKDSQNTPTSDLASEQPELIKQKSISNRAANPAYCAAFNGVNAKSEVYHSPYDGTYRADYWYTYRMDIEVIGGPGTTIGSVNPDQVRGFSAKGLISRTVIPKCECDSDHVIGNPIDSSTGAKVEFDADYIAPSGMLRLERAYNSQIPSLAIGMGTKGSWQHGYERALMWDSSYPNYVTAFRTNSDMQFFVKSNGTWSRSATSNTLFLYQEENSATDSTFRLFDQKANPTEFYDSEGRLLRIEGIDDELFLTYGTGKAGVRYPSGAPECIGQSSTGKNKVLMCVTSRFGRQLNFFYGAAGALTAVKDPAGNQIDYKYDGYGNLLQVTYPDNAVKVYHYNEAEHTGGAQLLHALTGISTGPVADTLTRYATFKYDALGRVVSTEHANGVNRYAVSYDTARKQSTVTDPAGLTKTFTFTVNNRYPRPTNSTLNCDGCTAATSSKAYDANGNITSAMDFNGNKTTRTFDLARNLETSRIEGAGTSYARTISTRWHATFGLPVAIASPKLLTTYTYDSTGHLLSKTEQPTSDTNGTQAFAAVAVGAPRNWSWSYNAAGKMLTHTGPLGDVTSYEYDAQGNILKQTNAAGHSYTFTNHDEHGRARRMVDPNGLVTGLHYSPRGWLTSKTVGGEVTAYTYDAGGQLLSITQPDGAKISYTYDAARRLTSIADGRGNSIVYTLDTRSNRVSEQIYDANGMLTRQTTRIYDALNRLEQVTGAQQ